MLNLGSKKAWCLSFQPIFTLQIFPNHSRILNVWDVKTWPGRCSDQRRFVWPSVERQCDVTSNVTEKMFSLQMFQVNGSSFTVEAVSFHIMIGTSVLCSLLNDPVLQSFCLRVHDESLSVGVYPLISTQPNFSDFKVF